MFNKILIANRGEIACRIMRTAQRLGIECVAVYSDADRHSRFVEMADEAWPLGGSTPAESYLRGDRIIEIAKQCRAEAVHPGYGFLSENAQFAEQCARKGLVFIGPPVAAIELMGSKSTAKFVMEEAQVPLIPGYHGADQNDANLSAQAETIGYPILVKASAGGGGKGMRVVEREEDLVEALASARREAQSAFGNDRLLLEKYIAKPRHVEIQVFCDQHGNGVYLFERDCSVQRRHQKVIEEAPAPGLSERTRQAMGQAALNCARAIQYEGAGTVEFLLDSRDQFYFMEMNTRLQVEHPVTEMITGQDLVEWQLRIAAGQPIPVNQGALHIHGHAFEARIYAEDPQRDFLPCAGRIDFLRTPKESPHVRLDSGVRAGDDIGVFYDPMIAKLIVWDEDRNRALTRLSRALREYCIGGVTTNIPFLYRLTQNRRFKEGAVHTGLIAEQRNDLIPEVLAIPNEIIPIGVLAWLHQQQLATLPHCGDPWDLADDWRLNSLALRPMVWHLGEEQIALNLERSRHGYRLRWRDQDVIAFAETDGEEIRAYIDGVMHRATVSLRARQVRIFKAGHGYTLSLPETDYQAADAKSGNQLRAPMNGRVISLIKAPGERVEAGEILLIVEAMKMEHPIRSPFSGTLLDILCSEGDLVQADQELVRLEPDERPDS